MINAAWINNPARPQPDNADGSNNQKLEIMNAQFNEKCKSFAKEIKKESGSWMSENLNYNQLVLLRQEYNWILRSKKNADPDDEIYSFFALDKEIQDTVRYSVKASKNLSNDQLLKLIISVDLFYLPIDIIKKIILL